MFNDILKLLNGDLATGVGVLSSIFSFIISILVYLGIRKIRKFYLFTVRAPEIVQKLSEIASSISDNLDSFNGYNKSIYTLLSDAEINLKSLNKKVDGKLSRHISNLIGDIKSVDSKTILEHLGIGTFNKENKTETQKDVLQKIYVSLYKIIGECKEIQEDNKWRS